MGTSTGFASTGAHFEIFVNCLLMLVCRGQDIDAQWRILEEAEATRSKAVNAQIRQCVKLALDAHDR